MPFGLGATLDQEETALFLDYLRTMVRVNLPIDVGLKRLASEATSRRIRALADELQAPVSEGATLVAALRKVPTRISPLVLALLEAGELSGNLAQMLEHVSRHCRSGVRLGNAFRQALLYPKLVMALVLLGIVPISMFAAARTATIARDVEAPPALTSWVVWIALGVVNHPLTILALGAPIALALFHPGGPLRRLGVYHRRLHSLKLNLNGKVDLVVRVRPDSPSPDAPDVDYLGFEPALLVQGDNVVRVRVRSCPPLKGEGARFVRSIELRTLARP